MEPREDVVFARLALRSGVLTRRQVRTCFATQRALPQRIKLGEIAVRMGYVSLREVLGVIQVGRRLDKLRGTERPRVSPGLQVAVALGAHRPVPAPLLACPLPAAGDDPFAAAHRGDLPWQGYDAFADFPPTPLAALPVDPLELPLPPIAPTRLRTPPRILEPKTARATPVAPAPALAPALTVTPAPAIAPPPAATPARLAPEAPAPTGGSGARSWPHALPPSRYTLRAAWSHATAPLRLCAQLLQTHFTRALRPKGC